MDRALNGKNYPDAADIRMPDAHGHAALLLVESLIHSLIANGTITTEDAIETVDVALAVTAETVETHGHLSASYQESLGLLSRIDTSLSHDRKSS